VSRYGNTARRNEYIADALRMAAGAADEHYAYINLNMEMANFASIAQLVTATTDEKEKAELMEALVQGIVSCGRLHGLIGKD